MIYLPCFAFVNPHLGLQVRLVLQEHPEQKNTDIIQLF
jgi:hypothetical protein